MASWHNLLFTLLTLLQMASSGIPGVTDEAVRYVQRALLPDLSSAEAAAVVGLIEKYRSLGSERLQLTALFMRS